MTPRTTLAAALVLAILLPSAVALLGGCQENPPEPVFTSPFDPAGPADGDPLDAQAQYSNGVLTVSWTHLEGYDIARYGIEWSLDPDGGYADLVTDLPATPSVYVVPDSATTPNETQYFKVQAITFGGEFTLNSYATAAGVAVPPWMQPVPPGFSRTSRLMDLKIVVGRGDSVLIADNEAMTDPDTMVAAAPGDTLEATFDWGPRDGNGELLNLYLLSFGGDYVSTRNEQNFSVDFNPDFTVQDLSGTGTVATRDIVLEIPLEGVQDMRFAADQGDLDGVAPVVPAATHPYRLADQMTRQTVWGRFTGDFGFTTDVPVDVTPDRLQTVTFEVRDSDRVVDTPWAPVRCFAVATRMRFSSSVDFAGAPWIPYADTTSIPLDPTPGRQVIYAQYRNDWVDSAVLTDYVDFIAQPVSVVILAPEEGTLLPGGTTLRILGSATGGSGAVLTNVALDLGDDAGFSDLGAEENWSFDWDIPRFAQDTEVVLRARAYTAVDSATTSVLVTVTQLAITIGQPTVGTVYGSEEGVTISGKTVPDLGGAVDSVTVDAGGTHLSATGTTDWTVGWTTPATTDSLGLAITATAWAGGETVQAVVEIGVDGREP